MAEVGVPQEWRRNNVMARLRTDRPTLVFGHGFGASQHMWSAVADDVVEDYGVVLFDHVGAGDSDLSAYEPRRYRSLTGYAVDLLELLETLPRPVDYVGHSAGGMIGLLAAVRRPECFRSLTMVGASPRYLNDDGYFGGFTRTDLDDLLTSMEDNFVGWAHATAPVVMANPDRPELAEALEASFLRTARHTALGFARAIFESDHRAELARVRTPTLVVQSAEDPMVPTEVAEFLHAHIADSRLVLLSTTGHFPHVSGPAAIADAIRCFVDGLEHDASVA